MVSEGYLNLCYRPVPSAHGNSSTPTWHQPDNNASFLVWYNGDFGLCFEYLVFVAAVNALFGVTSALYAGSSRTKLQRKRKSFAFILRLLLSVLIVLNGLTSFVGAFWLSHGRPYSVLLSEVVLILAWCLHIICIWVLSRSIEHYGWGPSTLNTVWFITFVGTVLQLRTVLRAKFHEALYDRSSLPIRDAYFSDLLDITLYVHFGLQCLYGLSLLLKVSQVTGDNVKLFPGQRRVMLLNSGSLRWNDDVEGSVREHLISSRWAPVNTPTSYGSLSGSINGSNNHLSLDRTKFDTSEDKANPLSLLSFWWVQPLMKRGALGWLQKPEDLLQLPKSLNTSSLRNRFQHSLHKQSTRKGRLLESSTHEEFVEARGYRVESLSKHDEDSDEDEEKDEQVSSSDESVNSGTWEESLRANMESSDSHLSQHTFADMQEISIPYHRHSSSVTLIGALNRAFGLHYYPLGVLKLTADLLGFAGPLLLHQLVAFMENRNEPIAHGYYYALGLFLSTLFCALLNTHFNYQVNKVGLKIRAAIITEIYRKSLAVSSTSMSKFSTGQVVNFMSTDTDRIVNFGQSFHQFWSLPFQIIISFALIVDQVGLASLTGVGFCVLLIPINRWLAVKIGKLSKDMMEQKDNRVKVMSEILTGIRVIKFYAWEKNFIRKIWGLRSAELKSLKGRKYLDALCVYFWATTPVLISILTFATYVAMGKELTAAKVFTCLALFNILISPLNAFPWVINGLVEAWVSAKRVQNFLQLEELNLDEYYSDTSDSRATDGGHCHKNGNGASILLGRRQSVNNMAVTIKNGYFTWTRDGGDDASEQTGQTRNASRDTGSAGRKQGLILEDSESEPKAVEFILSDLNLTIRSGQFIGVVGKVGSGKSSLLSAILAETRKLNGMVSVADLSCGFGLSAQEAWIQHATVRENILFGQPFHVRKYSDVVSACALEQDFQMLPAGDRTEVGENGVTLSGGQKARVALARAIYQEKSVYLLDDPLAAVDAHVATHLYNHCIMGLLRHKTRVLCTHHVRFLQEADLVVVMENGHIINSGAPNLVLPQVQQQLTDDEEVEDDGSVALLKVTREDTGQNEEIQPQELHSSIHRTLSHSDSNMESERGSVKDDSTDVLVKEEEKEVGVVAFSVYRAYWTAVGYVLAPSILFALFLMQASRNANDWWLAYWISHSHNSTISNITSAYTTTAITDPIDTTPLIPLTTARDNLEFYLGIYGGLAAANTVFTLFRAFLFAYGGICAATVIHKKLLFSILRAPVSFFDVTPIGRIVNRFSSDLYAIDDSLPFIMNILLAQFYGLLGTIIITCYGLPWFMILLLPLGLLYYNTQKYYRRTSRELKRLSTVTLSPIYAHFSETLKGLCTIRALRASWRFMQENEAKLEVNQRANYGSYAVAQWLGIRLQMLGVAMVAGVAFIAVLEHHFNTVDPGLVGLAISYALSVTNLLSGVVTSFTETEKQMVSVERAMQYIKGTPSEREQGILEPPPNWPSKGVVEFRGALLMYRVGLPPALREITFITSPAEKLGVVGRTGAGKSSLFQALFRIVELTSGAVLVDGIDISTISLKKLRSALAVIPQDPFLFSGSVRENLDPCGKHTDNELWSVLERCHLRVPVRNLGGLDAEVEERGRVFSVGQRQLICLARALLTEAKVICIDEATASVDLETDSQIQQTIRSEFTASTVITIAHRIETVLNSDRIMVMDQGRVHELGTPRQLLDDQDSLFSALYREHSM